MSPMVLDASTPQAPTRPLAEFVRELQQRVERNRRQWRTVIVLEALGLALIVPLAYLWAVFFLDSVLYLPVAGRVMASIGLIVGVAWAARYLWARRRQR